MELRDITYSIDDHVAQVSLVRSSAMNAIRPRTIEEFEMVMERLGKNGVRGLVITGVGLVFCSGLDPAMTNGSNASNSFQRLIQALLRRPGRSQFHGQGITRRRPRFPKSSDDGSKQLFLTRPLSGPVKIASC